MNKTFKMNYLARDFSSIKEELTKYAKRYYADTLVDMSEASVNTFLIESIAYAGDVLSYYLDFQTNESFLATAVEEKNILSLAKSLGYKEKDTASTTGKVAMYLFLPENGNLEPDYSKAPIIKKGTQLRSIKNVFYITTEDVIIDENLIGVNYIPARINSLGNPTYFAVKIYVPVISGIIESVDIEIDSFSPFRQVFLNSGNVIEVTQVTDAEGNIYYEVPNLTQNIVYKSFLNSDSEPKYILKPISAQRRFVFEYNAGNPYLLFGNKQYKPDDDLTIDPVVEPSKVVLNKYNNDHLADSFFEPNALLNGDTFGVAPDSTTLRVLYRKNNNVSNDAGVAEVNEIYDLKYDFLNTIMSGDEKSTIISSIQVVNEEEIIGENKIESLQQIKNLSGQIYAAQNRAVTSKDYETLTYMMPQKYGAIKRVKAYRDPTSLKNNINLYVCCANNFGFLTKTNLKIRENLKTWLSEYKILTDTVDILDAKIINLGINYSILIDPNADKVEVLNNVKEQLKYIYSFKPQIGESFNILDVYREIRKNKNVLDILDVKIRNITDNGYSSVNFNISNNLTSDGKMIKIPRNAIYEVRFPESDIIGSAV